MFRLQNRRSEKNIEISFEKGKRFFFRQRPRTHAELPGSRSHVPEVVGRRV